jgi:hypothetical protein
MGQQVEEMPHQEPRLVQTQNQEQIVRQIRELKKQRKQWAGLKGTWKRSWSEILEQLLIQRLA